MSLTRFGVALMLATFAWSCSPTTPGQTGGGSGGGSTTTGGGSGGGAASSGGGSGGGDQPDAGPTGNGETKTVTIGADGGSVSVGCHSISVPAGALSNDVQVTLTNTTQPSPAGYQTFSPVVSIEPADTQLAAAATLSLCFTGNSQLATVFLSRPDAGGYERLGGLVTGSSISTPVMRFGDAFVADGVVFNEQPDRSCARLTTISSRTFVDAGIWFTDGGAGGGAAVNPLSSSVAVVFRAEDCQGRPFVGLDSADFTVSEDDIPLSVESNREIFPARGLQAAASLVLDLSGSTQPHLPQVIDAAKAFVIRIQSGTVTVPISIQLFAGGTSATEWQAATLDTEKLLQRLDEVPTFDPPDPSSTNLYGAVVDASNRIGAWQQNFRQRNANGVFTTGFLVLFTDGADTSGLKSISEASTALQNNGASALAVALNTGDFSAPALNALSTLTSGSATDSRNVFVADSPERLRTDFEAVAYRIATLAQGSYLLGYCSPKRSGMHTVQIGLTGVTDQQQAEASFSAVGFGPGCSSQVFDAVCVDKECGGIGCGACDDRTSKCNVATLKCDSFCQGPPLRCGGEVFTNPQGYEQACVDSVQSSSCNGKCTDLSISVTNCGTCGNVCSGATSDCESGTCVCPAGSAVCNGQCVSLSNPGTCGSCTNACASNQDCVSASCVAANYEWSRWPTPAIAPPTSAYMTTTDTVVDAVTGLMWQRVVNATTYTWANAKTYCDNLTLASYSDWRLPTVIELESIVDLSVYNPSINATAFPSTPSTWFWSSSPAAHNSSSAWLVHFDYGSSDPFNNIANPYRVRCVR